MKPLVTFNPEIPCHVTLNKQTIEWNPQWAPLYREHGVLHDKGVIAWAGLLLDHWSPIVQQGMN